MSHKLSIRLAKAKKLNPLETVTPRALKLYNGSFEQSKHCSALPCEADVVGTASFVDLETKLKSVFPVNLDLQTCSCMSWLNIGVPCGHAISVANLFDTPRRRGSAWRLSAFHPRFHISNVIEAYSVPLIPVTTQLPDIPSWVIVPFTLQSVNRTRGRPVTNRLKGPEERGSAKLPLASNDSEAALDFSAQGPQASAVAAPAAAKARKPRKQEACTACQQVGHRKTSKQCPKYEQTRLDAASS